MSEKPTADTKPQSVNRSVTRAISILRALGSSTEPLTSTDIAKRINIPRPTTFRLLSTLEDEGFVERTETLYSLGWDLARLAQSVDPATKLAARARDVLDDIAEEVGETVTLSFRRGNYELVVALQSTPTTVRFAVAEMQGLTFPHHASSTGKVLLAELEPETVPQVTGNSLGALTQHTITDHQKLREELDQVRAQGWAYNNEELEDGIFSSAVPIRDSNGILIAALSLMASTSRISTEEERTQATRRLLKGADRLQGVLVTSPHIFD